jgi:hypothetical protein
MYSVVPSELEVVVEQTNERMYKGGGPTTATLPSYQAFVVFVVRPVLTALVAAGKNFWQ